LESLLRSTHEDFEVIVCDSGSTDDSVSRISDWAAGEQVFSNIRLNPRLSEFSTPPVVKPVALRTLSFAEAQRSFSPSNHNPRLTLIRCENNVGFAAANNIGLRYALFQGVSEYFWLLNNDTVVTGNALSCLAQRMGQAPDIGILGSKLIDYYDVCSVQALGGAAYNPWFARGRHLYAFTSPDLEPSSRYIEHAMDYVIGASMFVSRSFLLQIGVMNEDLFLYFEELDWALRAKGKFRLGYCEESVLYHKQGSSTHKKNAPSAVADYFSTRNKLLMTRKHFPFCLPSVFISLLLRVLIRLFQGAYWNAYVVLRALSGPRRLSPQEALNWLDNRKNRDLFG
jgi:GT2 family glycosyltransferase